MGSRHTTEANHHTPSFTDFPRRSHSIGRGKTHSQAVPVGSLATDDLHIPAVTLTDSVLFDLIRFVFPTHKFLACLPLIGLWSRRKSCIDSMVLPHKFSRQ